MKMTKIEQNQKGERRYYFLPYQNQKGERRYYFLPYQNVEYIDWEIRNIFEFSYMEDESD